MQDEAAEHIEEKVDDQLIDASKVIMFMAVEGQGSIPAPLPLLFEKLFGILNHIDRRLIALEDKLKVTPEGERRVITLDEN